MPPAAAGSPSLLPPSPVWYASRGLGLVLLLTLTCVMVIGIAVPRRWRSDRWPAFALTALHRNLSLLALVLLPLHAGAAWLDPFPHLGPTDLLVPFASPYRRVWLGLGVMGGELLVALVATSLVRGFLGRRLWRLTHWAAYACWPLTVVHGLGTGSDARAGWALAVYTASVLAVSGAVLARLYRGRPATRSWRAALAAVTLAGVGVGIGWAAGGPLRPGWAAAAGTPRQLLGSTFAPSPSPQGPGLASVPVGLDDALTGTIAIDAIGAHLELTDTRDRSLAIVLVRPGPAAPAGPLTVTSAGRVICRTEAQFEHLVFATCGSTEVEIVLGESTGSSAITAELITKAAP